MRIAMSKFASTFPTVRTAHVSQSPHRLPLPPLLLEDWSNELIGNYTTPHHTLGEIDAGNLLLWYRVDSHPTTNVSCIVHPIMNKLDLINE
jgi:hypothetical protein